MEIAKNEVAAVKEIAAKAEQIAELQDLELMLVGGGLGDITLG